MSHPDTHLFDIVGVFRADIDIEFVDLGRLFPVFAIPDMDSSVANDAEDFPFVTIQTQTAATCRGPV